MNKKQIISDYIASRILGVVATVNDKGNPEAALVAITEASDLELIFGTNNTARKYQNLKNNAHVAITVGDDVDEAITVQYEGIAEELSGKALDYCRDLHVRKNPRSKKYAYLDGQRFFKVKPTWIRYTDLGSNPRVEFEIKF